MNVKINKDYWIKVLTKMLVSITWKFQPIIWRDASHVTCSLYNFYLRTSNRHTLKTRKTGDKCH